MDRKVVGLRKHSGARLMLASRSAKPAGDRVNWVWMRWVQKF